MWERWGSPDINDFPGADAEERREAAVVAALTSGLIHGSKSVLDARLAPITGYVYDDALCAPVVPSRYTASLSEPILRTFAPPQYIDGLGAGPVPAVGDLFLGRLTRTQYRGQYDALYACAASGIREVYLAAGSNHGAASPSRTDTVDPTSEACLGQRATNSSFYLGLGVDYTVPSRARRRTSPLPATSPPRPSSAAAPSPAAARGTSATRARPTTALASRASRPSRASAP